VSAGGWRNLCAVLGLACGVLAWRDCGRTPAVGATTSCDDRGDRAARATRDGRDDDDRPRRREPAAAAATDGDGDDGDETPAWSFTAPAWVMWLAPQPGENLLHYRDRIVPLAQAAVAPHRARVARGLDDFATQARLDERQRAELHAAVEEAATEIQDRVLGAALGGDLSPSTFKPTTGVALARDVLDAVDRANRRFQASLGDEQRAALTGHPFDVADYLLFSTRWEDMLGAP
jgi:hypothetical protein